VEMGVTAGPGRPVELQEVRDNVLKLARACLLTG